MAPHTKVEESFNVQAMHDILHHRQRLEKYDHLEFPGVVPRTFIGALLVSTLASPVVLAESLLQLPKIYSLYAVRLVLGFIILSSLRFFRIQLKKNFGSQVEGFFVILTALQFHMLFYCTRPFLTYWHLAWLTWHMDIGLTDRSMQHYIVWYVTILFLKTIGRYLPPSSSDVTPCCLFHLWGLSYCWNVIPGAFVYLLLSRSISLKKAVISCLIATIFCIGVTVLVDSVLWRRWLWPELEVFWFNSVLNRSSEWDTLFSLVLHVSTPRSLLAAYPLFVLGAFLDRRVLLYIIPVLSFVLLYSKLPHKELRFIISSLPIFNFCAAVGAARIYNNRKKSFWKYLYVAMLGSFFISLGCTILTFMASYENYPSGYALKSLHNMGHLTINSNEVWVHIDTFSAMNGISRFCENNEPWRYSKEEEIPLQEFQSRNFMYLLSEHAQINGYKCLFSVNGFSGTRLHTGFPPISLVKEPKVYVHGNAEEEEIIRKSWPGC